jgi:hypothetical protein
MALGCDFARYYRVKLRLKSDLAVNILKSSNGIPILVHLHDKPAQAPVLRSSHGDVSHPRFCGKRSKFFRII